MCLWFCFQSATQKFPRNVICNQKYNILTFIPLVSIYRYYPSGGIFVINMRQGCDVFFWDENLRPQYLLSQEICHVCFKVLKKMTVYFWGFLEDEDSICISTCVSNQNNEIGTYTVHALIRSHLSNYENYVAYQITD